MRVLVLGGSGMLGHKVFQVLSARYEAYATFRDPQGLWRYFPFYAAVAPQRLLAGVDAADLDGITRAIAAVQPQVVINCIGIIKQLPAANDPIRSIGLNALFPHRLAQLCALAGARLLHFSTDCVFSGNKGNYVEDDFADASDLYGRSKFLGEVDRPGCLTIRTSIIGRDFLKSSGLLEWFLGQRGRRARGYKNAIYSGFPTQVLATIIGDIIADHPQLTGICQIASAPISKYALLVKIKQALQLDLEIEPYDDPPCDRSLSAARFVAQTGYQIPTWDSMIAQLAADRTPYDEWRARYAIA